MKAPSPNQIAYLLPITFLLHQLEEYFGQFPLWFSNLLNAELSKQDFIIINGPGLFIITAFSLSYIVNRNKIILLAIGTLVFVNGIMHLIFSILTFSYSPGAISGAVLFIPLGILIFMKILPKLEESKRIIAIGIGIVVLFSVSLIAVNI